MIVNVVPILILFAAGFGHFLIDLVGFVYPLYASIKAVETCGKEDDTMWLTYWIVFALFKIIEGVASILLNYIPFYYLGKMAFLVWCYHPNSKGAEIIYSSVIKPFVVPLIVDNAPSKKID